MVSLPHIAFGVLRAPRRATGIWARALDIDIALGSLVVCAVVGLGRHRASAEGLLPAKLRAVVRMSCWLAVARCLRSLKLP